MILPAATERPIVVFQVWPSLAYGTRFLAAFLLIGTGLAVQMIHGTFLWGALLIVAGNLFTLVSGYDNRVDYGKFDPGAEWVPVESERLAELRRLDREIRRWDTSALDVSNPLGAVAFLVVATSLAGIALIFPGPVRVLTLDAALLLLPHWLTGLRRVLRLPRLLVKVELLQHLFAACDRELRDRRVRLLMLLGGARTRLPGDVKFRVDPAGGPEGYLGLHGQVVLNEVQGRSYPYFYVVLVARLGYGLRELYGRYVPPDGITKEFKRQDEVEVLVIRQATTKTSGYHTDPHAAARILREGLVLSAEAVASGP
jgi:hypothetical protein